MKYVGAYQGSKEGNEKTLRAKVLGGSQKIFWETLQLFSSFLRGASCPKSPRFKCDRIAIDSPQPQLLFLCLKRQEMSRANLGTKGGGEKCVTTNPRLAASNTKGEP
jgi:hypothetical protein